MSEKRVEPRLAYLPLLAWKWPQAAPVEFDADAPVLDGADRFGAAAVGAVDGDG